MSNNQPVPKKPPGGSGFNNPLIMSQKRDIRARNKGPGPSLHSDHLADTISNINQPQKGFDYQSQGYQGFSGAGADGPGGFRAPGPPPGKSAVVAYKRDSKKLQQMSKDGGGAVVNYKRDSKKGLPSLEALQAHNQRLSSFARSSRSTEVPLDFSRFSRMSQNYAGTNLVGGGYSNLNYPGGISEFGGGPMGGVGPGYGPGPAALQGAQSHQAYIDNIRNSKGPTTQGPGPAVTLYDPTAILGALNLMGPSPEQQAAQQPAGGLDFHTNDMYSKLSDAKAGEMGGMGALEEAYNLSLQLYSGNEEAAAGAVDAHYSKMLAAHEAATAYAEFQTQQHLASSSASGNTNIRVSLSNSNEIYDGPGNAAGVSSSAGSASASQSTQGASSSVAPVTVTNPTPMPMVRTGSKTQPPGLSFQEMARQEAVLGLMDLVSQGPGDVNSEGASSRSMYNDSVNTGTRSVVYNMVDIPEDSEAYYGEGGEILGGAELELGAPDSFNRSTMMDHYNEEEGEEGVFHEDGISLEDKLMMQGYQGGTQKIKNYNNYNMMDPARLSEQSTAAISGTLASSLSYDPSTAPLSGTISYDPSVRSSRYSNVTTGTNFNPNNLTGFVDLRSQTDRPDFKEVRTPRRDQLIQRQASKDRAVIENLRKSKEHHQTLNLRDQLIQRQASKDRAVMENLRKSKEYQALNLRNSKEHQAWAGPQTANPWESANLTSSSSSTGPPGFELNMDQIQSSAELSAQAAAVIQAQNMQLLQLQHQLSAEQMMALQQAYLAQAHGNMNHMNNGDLQSMTLNQMNENLYGGEKNDNFNVQQQQQQFQQHEAADTNSKTQSYDNFVDPNAAMHAAIAAAQAQAEKEAVVSVPVVPVRLGLARGGFEEQSYD